MLNPNVCPKQWCNRQTKLTGSLSLIEGGGGAGGGGIAAGGGGLDWVGTVPRTGGGLQACVPVPHAAMVPNPDSLGPRPGRLRQLPWTTPSCPPSRRWWGGGGSSVRSFCMRLVADGNTKYEYGLLESVHRRSPNCHALPPFAPKIIFRKNTLNGATI